MMRTIPCLARVMRPIKKYKLISEKTKPTTITFQDTFTNRLVIKIMKVYIVSYGLIVLGTISVGAFLLFSIAKDEIEKSFSPMMMSSHYIIDKTKDK